MNKIFMKKCRAFSLAELMIVMLILTIILAATMPILSKRAKVKAAASAAGGGAIKTANEGDDCIDGTDTIAYSKDDGEILICLPKQTLGGSCTNIGSKAVDKDNSVGTLNPYVHLVCIN